MDVGTKSIDEGNSMDVIKYDIDFKNVFDKAPFGDF